MFVDSHCHLQLMDYAELGCTEADLVQQAIEAKVRHLLCVATHPEQMNHLLAIQERYKSVSVSFGLHPNEEIETELSVEQWLNLCAQKPIVAVGETGLDYYRSKGDLEWQRQRFRTQIRVARQLDKPLIIHTRAAKQDTINILKEESAQDVGGVLHCFTEDWEMAEQALELGFLISFSGIVTFKNATELQEVAKLVPLDKMLIETDCPYLAPVPYRGKVNRPSYVPHVAEFIAKLRHCSLQSIAENTTNNFQELFKVTI